MAGWKKEKQEEAVEIGGCIVEVKSITDWKHSMKSRVVQEEWINQAMKDPVKERRFFCSMTLLQ